MPGPGVLGGVLGRLADQPGQRDQRGRREHELERLRRVERRSARGSTSGASATDAKRMRRTMAADATRRARCLKIGRMSSLAERPGSAHNPGVEQPVAGTDRASAPPSGRGRVPPLRGALRQGRLPRGVHRALVPVRLRVRGVGSHLRRLHAEGLRGRDRPRPAAGGGGAARTASAAIRATGAPLPMCKVEVAPCYEAPRRRARLPQPGVPRDPARAAELPRLRAAHLARLSPRARRKACVDSTQAFFSRCVAES